MRISDKSPDIRWLKDMPMRMALLAVLGSCVAPRSVTPSKCGDGVMDSITDEECDDGDESASCDIDCTLSMCGDGHVNAVAGEECDDRDTVSGDGCSAACQIERCDAGESCLASYCGDGVVDEAAGEACDAGDVETADCDLDCSLAWCGDGYVNITAGEECEGGASIFCDSDCTGAWCGDGMPNAVAGEECDDGNADDRDWCLATCESASCEDGIRNGDEQGVDCGGHCHNCVEPMVVAGELHTCMLMGTGKVRCWGRGRDGRLGYGDEGNVGDNEAPKTAGDVDVGGRVVQLAAGHRHTCALMETGAVRCWGDGGDGRLGYGTQRNIGDNEVPATAGDVDVGGRVVQVAAGDWHTCALMETGAVRCWGLANDGQLGYGNQDNIGDNEAPATAGDVDVGGGVVQLATGQAHTCALMETGAVRCWGYGYPLEYVNENSIQSFDPPATMGDVDVGGRVVQLAAGQEHTCALMETGVVRCWGYGGYGQLGYGNMNRIGDDEAPATAGDVDIGGRVVQLTAGISHTCAVMETGAVRCWGHGSSLGYGNTNRIGDDETPATAGDVDVGGRVVQLAAGHWHTCAVMETEAVRCWGPNSFGCLGYSNTPSIGDNETPASAGDVPYR